jgi:hypothetical protein
MAEAEGMQRTGGPCAVLNAMHPLGTIIIS